MSSQERLELKRDLKFLLRLTHRVNFVSFVHYRKHVIEFLIASPEFFIFGGVLNVRYQWPPAREKGEGERPSGQPEQNTLNGDIAVTMNSQ